jgi:hypothetical protein
MKMTIKGGGLALQRGPFGSVADDQRPEWHAAGPHDRGCLEQGSDAFVGSYLLDLACVRECS